ncbi:MAG: alpha/beta fold hydrolase [Thermoanaerobaculales bacterium]|jgi:haloalkane dehalogenase|nr:alpha/beta fold hydrolase [Thermoanaerobaculales bacterium]
MKHIAKDLYPFDSHFMDLGGLRLHYLDEGEGEPVVAVHGNPTWSFYYRELVKDLRADHRVLAVDHMGCGLSDRPDDESYPFTLERRVADFETFMDRLSLDRVNLVVHDWGGAIGCAWAGRNPDRVKRLVILNTAAFHLPPSKPLPWQLWLVRNTPLGAGLVRGLNGFARGATWLGCTRRRMPKEVRDAICAPYDSWEARRAVLRFVEDIPLQPGDRGFDLVTEIAGNLPKLASKPVLICWGDKDFVFDHHFLAEWLKIFPDAELHRYPDGGHYILEDYADEIVPLIRDFVTHSATS